MRHSKPEIGLWASALEKINTEDKLLVKLRRGASVHPSSQELFEQRVSFVLGGIDSESSVTREQVRRVLEKDSGSPNQGSCTEG